MPTNWWKGAANRGSVVTAPSPRIIQVSHSFPQVARTVGRTRPCWYPLVNRRRALNKKKYCTPDIRQSGVEYPGVQHLSRKTSNRLNTTPHPSTAKRDAICARDIQSSETPEPHVTLLSFFFLILIEPKAVVMGQELRGGQGTTSHCVCDSVIPTACNYY